MRPPDRTLLLAGAGFAVAALVFAAALARALMIEPTTPDPLATALTIPDRRDQTPRSVGADGPLTFEALALAIDNDPFQPDRRRPDEPYRMPGEFVQQFEELPPAPPPPLRLLGVADMGSGGLAVMQAEDAMPRVVSVGESMLGYVLAGVAGDTATLTGQGRVLTLTVAQASPYPAPDRDERRRRGDDDDDDDDDDDRRESVETLQRMLERRLRGRNDQVYERLRGIMRLRSRDGRTIEFDNGRIIIRSDTNLVRNLTPDG